MKHYKAIADARRDNGFPPPLHPMIALQRCRNVCSMEGTAFTSDFYIIGFKKLVAGFISYGRTKYDHSNGSMMFIKPRQVMAFNNLQFEEDGFLIFIHEDFFNGHPLHEEIKKYSYFEYETDEALHLSPREEEIIWDLYNRIDAEYNNNLDEFSRDIILSHIDSILKYAQRFYKRQFINRAELSGKTVSRFNQALGQYAAGGQLLSNGLPSVNVLAAQLNLSPRYLSDLLKQETGKTAMELIHIYLIGEAKNRLKSEYQSVSEIAYTLGFENLSYFSKVFKKETGLTPVQFKRQLVN